jgi:hypothetical protein
MCGCCECCVLSRRGFCDELITRPEESYRQWCVVVCDLETSWMRRSWPTGGRCANGGEAHSKLKLRGKDNKGCPDVETSLPKEDSRKKSIHADWILSFVLPTVYISHILFHSVSVATQLKFFPWSIFVF